MEGDDALSETKSTAQSPEGTSVLPETKSRVRSEKNTSELLESNLLHQSPEGGEFETFPSPSSEELSSQLEIYSSHDPEIADENSYTDGASGLFEAKPSSQGLRAIDFVVCADPCDIPIEESIRFKLMVPSGRHSSGVNDLFSVPQEVRRQIYSYIFPKEKHPILLSPIWSTKETRSVGNDGKIPGDFFWPEDFFVPPGRILNKTMQKVMSSSMAIRHEFMAYFWSEYKFHVILSPWTRPLNARLVHEWLPRFLEIVQHLTIEVDFTKYGGSNYDEAFEEAFGSAVRFRRDTAQPWLRRLCTGLSERRTGLTLKHLHIYCRKSIETSDPKDVCSVKGKAMSEYGADTGETQSGKESYPSPRVFMSPCLSETDELVSLMRIGNFSKGTFSSLIFFARDIC